MRQYLKVLLIFCFPLAAFAQPEIQLFNQRDSVFLNYIYPEDYTPEMHPFYRVINYDKKGKPVGLTRDYYMSGKLMRIGKLIDDSFGDKYDGVCTLFYEDSIIASKLNYKNGKLHGVCLKYDVYGLLNDSIYYINGEWKGGLQPKPMTVIQTFEEPKTWEESIIEQHISKTVIQKEIFKDSICDTLRYYNGRLQSVTIQIKKSNEKISAQTWNADGKLTFRCIPEFNESHIVKLDCKYGIKKGNKWILLPEYESIGYFVNDMSIVYKDKQCGIVDCRDGHFIMPLQQYSLRFVMPEYYEIFNNNIVEQNKFYSHYYTDDINYLIISKKGSGIMRMNGEIIIPPLYNYDIKFDRKANKIKVQKDHNIIGLFDTLGNMIIKPEYCSYTNNTHEYVINGQTVKKTFYFLMNPADGVILKQGTERKFGVIDDKGKMVVPVKYTKVEFPKNNLFFAYNRSVLDVYTIDGELLKSISGYLGKNQIYENDHTINWGDLNGFLIITNPHKGCTLIDDHGKVWFENADTIIRDKVDDLFRVTQNGKVQVFSAIKKVSLISNANQISLVEKQYYIVKTGNKFQLLKLNGELAIKGKYDNLFSISPYKGLFNFSQHNGLLVFKKKKHLEVYNHDLLKLKSFIADNISGTCVVASNSVVCYTGDFSKVLPLSDCFIFSKDGYAFFSGEQPYSSGILKSDGTFLIPPRYEIKNILKNNQPTEIYEYTNLTEGTKRIDLKVPLVYSDSTISYPEWNSNRILISYGNSFSKLTDKLGKNITTAIPGKIIDEDTSYIYTEVKNKKQGVFTKQGEMVVDTIYDYIAEADVKHGVFWVCKKQYYYFFDWKLIRINSISPDERIFRFPAKFETWGTITDSSEYMGVLKPDLTWLIPPKNYNMEYGDKFFWVKNLEEKYVQYDLQGKIINNKQYDSCYYLEEGLSLVYEKCFPSLINESGKVIVSGNKYLDAKNKILLYLYRYHPKLLGKIKLFDVDDLLIKDSINIHLSRKLKCDIFNKMIATISKQVQPRYYYYPWKSWSKMTINIAGSVKESPETNQQCNGYQENSRHIKLGWSFGIDTLLNDFISVYTQFRQIDYGNYDDISHAYPIYHLRTNTEFQYYLIKDDSVHTYTLHDFLNLEGANQSFLEEKLSEKYYNIINHYQDPCSEVKNNNSLGFSLYRFQNNGIVFHYNSNHSDTKIFLSYNELNSLIKDKELLKKFTR